jgi:hypothetical protein
MFKCDHGDGNVITMKMPCEITWPEAMDNFKKFLKGVGYFLPEEGCICNNPIREEAVNIWVNESAEDTEMEIGICDDAPEGADGDDDLVEITVTDGVPT